MKVLLGLGIAAVIAFAVLHLLGLRDDAGFLSGAPVSSTSGGLAYVLSYFFAVIVAPPLVLAAAFLALLKRFR